jgi:hypothetical protein
MSTDLLPSAESVDFVDDDSWAQPRAQAGRGWRVFAGLLALTILGIGFFTFGVKYQRSRPAAATGGAGAFGRNFPGGLGGAGFPGAGGTGSATGSGGATSPDLTAILGQLTGDTSTAAAGSSGTAVRGKVTKVDGTTLTITKSDGSTVTVTLSSETQVGRRSVAAASDVVAGADVLVSGPALGADGAVAADEITLGDLPTEPTTTIAATTPTTAPGLGGLLPG